MDTEEMKFWAHITSVVCLTLVAIIFLSILYSDRVNEMTLKADSCIKVIAINGGDKDRYLACNGK